MVYRGQRLSQLYGAYVFADYVTGNVWILRPDGTNTVPSQRIAGAASPVSFGTDPRDGDVLIAQLGGQIMRLNYDTTPVGTLLPPTLADTGAFSDLARLKVHAGIVPYDLNVPFWSDGAQTNATLVAEEGLDETFVIHDNGVTRTQTWHYPSRSECLTCHTTVGGGALGFNTAQMNRDFDCDGTTDNPIHALSQAGYFMTEVAAIHTLRALVTATNQAASLEARVRSYLAANCAQCHQPGGPTSASFDARLSTPTAQAGLIGGRLSDSGANDVNRVIQPGSAERSILLQRIAARGPKQMPPISTTVVDTNAVQLLTEWITKDAFTFQSFADWQMANFGEVQLPQAAAIADPDGDGASNYLEFLVGSNPLMSSGPWRISAQVRNGAVQIRFPQIARRRFEVQTTTNLFDPTSWSSLDVPSNRPFFSSTNFQAVVEDPILGAVLKFYRVRVFER